MSELPPLIAGFAGKGHRPFAARCDPAKPRVTNLHPPTIGKRAGGGIDADLRFCALRPKKAV
jgi:hypothetical protein